MIQARHLWYSSFGFVIIAGFLSYGVIQKQFFDDPVKDIPMNKVYQVVDTQSQQENSGENKAITILKEDVAKGLFVPWSMVQVDTDRFWITERSGALRVLEGGVLKEEPLYRFDEVSQGGEEGLMGLVLDPDFSTNGFFYVSLAYVQAESMWLKVERMQYESGVVTRSKTLLDRIPAAQYHAGSRLTFGPDDYLYITTGDGLDKEQAQDMSSLAGKVLRLTREGELPQGQNTPVFMSGLRNSQGLVLLDEETLFLSDHGPSLFDGPPGGDELNIGKQGDNFGWPRVSHEKIQEGMVSPQAIFTPAIAPAGVMKYTGDMFPEWRGKVFVSMLRGEGVLLVDVVEKEESWHVEGYERLDIENIGRVRDIFEAQDGSIYLLTSNRDGRGTVNEGDDRVIRLFR